MLKRIIYNLVLVKQKNKEQAHISEVNFQVIIIIIQNILIIYFK
jgi:hypothetical protein